ncbi:MULTISPECIES: hypothetical protein [unclassified Ensifer]|uniref:hypothetical protein n=1 Tax=unclassified Ensifer TaxID=2633371 RepID=UPI000712B4E1|nr:MULTISPECIES: hypothetical protein [unclassified Ensifer]KQX52179.1 hypothetical protein ASD49_31455 [Ensifer sp. Root1298]KQX85242.1 hypothetical protein ASD41_31260 [Ensifer sp. Root1312]KRC21359.1 hypothetical protein ASE29_30935 [Ensifer sp. Root74]KRD60956.1 hypothetical protein ASE71_32660 [Ensifer sp. Root954]
MAAHQGDQKSATPWKPRSNQDSGTPSVAFFGVVANEPRIALVRSVVLQLKDKAAIVFGRPIITKQRQIALKVHRRAGMNEGRFGCGKSFQLRDQTARQVRACFAQVSLRASGEPEARARCLIRIGACSKQCVEVNFQPMACWYHEAIAQ